MKKLLILVVCFLLVFAVAQAAGLAIETKPARNIGATSATLNGVLVSMGNSTSVDVHFYCGKYSMIWGGYATPEVTMTSPGSFSYNLTGLEPDTVYAFFAGCRGSDGTYGYGQHLLFKTKKLHGK